MPTAAKQQEEFTTIGESIESVPAIPILAFSRASRVLERPCLHWNIDKYGHYNLWHIYIVTHCSIYHRMAVP